MNKTIIAVLLFSVVVFITCKRPYCGPPDAECERDPGNLNLQNYYNFNNNRTDHVNSNLISNNGTAFGSDKNAVSSAALYFNGSGNYISVNNVFDIFEKTYSYWFKTNSYPSGVAPTNDYGYIMVLDNPNLSYGYVTAYVGTVGGVRQLTVGMGNPNQGAEVKINMDNFGNPFGWHHLAFVQKGTSVKIYLDAVLKVNVQISSYFGAAAGNNNLIFGTTRAINGRYYDGFIDEFRFYDRALDLCEINWLYKHYD